MIKLFSIGFLVLLLLLPGILDSGLDVRTRIACWKWFRNFLEMVGHSNVSRTDPGYSVHRKRKIDRGKDGIEVTETSWEILLSRKKLSITGDIRPGGQKSRNFWCCSVYVRFTILQILNSDLIAWISIVQYFYGKMLIWFFQLLTCAN